MIRAGSAMSAVQAAEQRPQPTHAGPPSFGIQVHRFAHDAMAETLAARRRGSSRWRPRRARPWRSPRSSRHPSSACADPRSDRRSRCPARRSSSRWGRPCCTSRRRSSRRPSFDHSSSSLKAARTLVATGLGAVLELLRALGRAPRRSPCPPPDTGRPWRPRNGRTRAALHPARSTARTHSRRRST